MDALAIPLEHVVTSLQPLQPVAVYVFGSRAYGKPRDDSDLDLLVVISRTSERTVEVARRARGLIGSIGIGVDVIVRTQEEFERRAAWPSNLESVVRTRGVLLHAG